MNKYLIPLLACSASFSVWADNCEQKKLSFGALPFAQSDGLAVIIGPYQFNLPEAPTALVAFDGILAAYPEKKYVSYQLITNDSVAGALSQFTTKKLSSADLDRYLYGLYSLESLNETDQALVRDMRSDMQLDCRARLTNFAVGYGVEAIFQEATPTDPEHRILLFANDSTYLISVRGAKEMALNVLQTITLKKQ
ncbi:MULTISPECIES: hypothetical protein [unclassified Pseudomonas]|uniref:hypothetical protein n=1 Tax=unclassified Pseudomonas TaxID=196821 RepID=UPI002B234796|nr:MULTISPECIES: hypothetical protein [unclassified Pseudomonas]MEA9979891.1 hypothetical protein [Pseudomonas sp. RTS4]MEB0199402.1 hypothetical protein [Pseudomonas sp. 5S4]MEB0246514.1 hypothetical protein [Pseudomonas sp. 10S5]